MCLDQRGTKAGLDNSGVTRERWIQANILVVQQCEGCSAICGFPQSVGRQAWSKSHHAAAQDGANSAHCPSGADIDDIRVVRIDNDR